MRVLAHRVLVAFAVAFLAAAVVTPSALAHGYLERSEPADGAALAEAPGNVRLWFSEAVSPKFSTAEVLDRDGRAVAHTSVRTSPADPRLLTILLPKLERGLYSVSWKTLSNEDGHFRQGLLVFGVGPGVDPRAAAVARAEIELSPLEVFLRWLNFSVLGALVGAAAIAGFVLAPRRSARHPEPVAPAAADAYRRVLAWATWCAWLGLFVGVNHLLWRAASLSHQLGEGASTPNVGWQLLSGSRWGALWLAREGILVVLVAVLILHRRRQGARSSPALLAGRMGHLELPTIGLLIVGLLVVQALGGHAAALSPGKSLAVGAAVLHLGAAGLWMGGLPAVVVALWPSFSRGEGAAGALARACWRRFSLLAALSIGLLVASGLYYAARQVASVDALITTLYGRALMAKVVLMLSAGVFGLLSSMLLHPRLALPLARVLGRPAGWTPLSHQRLRTLVLAELGLGLAVFAAAGVLTAAVPARGPEFARPPAEAAEDIPGSLTAQADDLVVTLSAKPNRPGENVFQVLAASTRRPAPGEIESVTMSFRGPGGESVSPPLREVESGRFRLSGDALSEAGSWRIDVVAERRGLADSVMQFDWTVGPLVPPRPVIVSNRPLEPLLTVAAAAAFVIVLTGAGWFLLGRRLLSSRGGQPRRSTLPSESA